MNSDLEVNELTWTVEHQEAPRISQKPVPAKFGQSNHCLVIWSRFLYKFCCLELWFCKPQDPLIIKHLRLVDFNCVGVASYLSLKQKSIIMHWEGWLTGRGSAGLCIWRRVSWKEVHPWNLLREKQCFLEEMTGDLCYVAWLLSQSDQAFGRS